MKNDNQPTNDLDIAIIGISGRFPGAKNIEEFWKNLESGASSILAYTDDELRKAGVSEKDLSDPNFIKFGALLEDIDLFDASFFGYTPREAEFMDPQQRILLEGAWEALESSGYDPESYKGLIGVYAGVGLNTYILHLMSDSSVFKDADSLQIALSNDKDYLATRISYKLNLKGPSITVQTACSTSLVCIHTACQSLLSYDTDMAIAGGVSIRTPHRGGYLHKEGSIMSMDGKCCAFDEKASGTVYGNGMGLVVLKRYKDAIEDGDYIHAIIKGSAINNDGALKVGFTAPSIEGQAKVIKDAIMISQIPKDSISYIETHGTGTKLGDPIEIEALNEVYAGVESSSAPIYIGSVKTNVGHLDVAAGVTGLIKTIMAMKNKKIPATLNFTIPNPQIPFSRTPFKVNNELIEWKPKYGVRRAGVSSFGMGGTNAHLIVEEAPSRPHETSKRPFQLLLFSARTDEALEDATKSIATHFDENPKLNLADAAYTLAVGRRPFEKRTFLVAKDASLASSKIKSGSLNQGAFTPILGGSTVFMFSGQGSQYVNMGKELYEIEPVFRETVDFCCEYLKPLIGIDLREYLYPASIKIAESERLLTQTSNAQPALFIIEYALSKLWENWGIRPNVLIGHSVGEYVAACLAGVFSLEDGLKLIAVRSMLTQRTQPGKMMAVHLSEAELTVLLANRNLYISVINGPELFVVSGSNEGIDEIYNDLKARGYVASILNTSHAFHSPFMDEIIEEFTSHVSKVQLSKPKLPYISNVTGTWITDEQATDPNYYASHLREATRFWDGVQTLVQHKEYIFLEVGPGDALSKIAKKSGNKLVLTSLPARSSLKSDCEFILETLGNCWAHRLSVNREAIYGAEKRNRVPLPTYQFQRESYWVSPGSKSGQLKLEMGKKRDVKDWFYRPVWKRSLPVKKRVSSSYRKFLLLAEKDNFAKLLAAQLEQEGHSVVFVSAGNEFIQIDERHFIINPKVKGHYSDLLKLLSLQDYVPESIIHLWSVSAEELSLEIELDLGVNSLIFFVQGLERVGLKHSLDIMIVTEGLFDITGLEQLKPSKALLIGPSKVLHQEFQNIKCRLIDLEIPENLTTPSTMSLMRSLAAELVADSLDLVVSYRGINRWIQFFDPEPLEVRQENILLRDRGIYLITGGMGGLGMLFAEHLVDSVQANLVLISRNGLPPRDRWQEIIKSEHPDQGLAEKIKFVLSLEEKGSKVLVIAADVADKSALKDAINEAEVLFEAPLNGVIHMAGIPGSGLMLLKTPETVCEVLAPKVQGVLNLSQVLKSETLDFFISFSSTLAITGGLGQVDYVAANAFLGAFSHSQSRNGYPMMTIDWDAWQIDSWQANALGATIPEIQSQVRELREKYGISAQEGIQAFVRVLSNLMPQVVVSTKDLEKTIYKHAFYSDLALEMEAKSKGNHAILRMQGDYVSPSNETERIIAGLWQDTLGIEQIGMTDNFFDLGGHSLLAIKLISRLREVFQIEIPMQTIFEYPTVKLMSEILLDMIVQQIEDMSEDEVVAMLEEKE
jgi:phthiocerol/phenolphthiocerol synthesis type-I polyketide synthase E